MKKIGLMLVLILAAASSAWCIENPWTRKLPFKQGVVTYEISGTMKGSEQVFVKDHGATTAAYRTEVSTMFGMTQETRELTLTTPDWVYSVDLSDNSGTRQVNPKKIIQEKFDALSRTEQKKLVKNSEELGVAMVGDMSGSVEKKALKLLGYKCDKGTAMGIDAYTLSGTDFPMKVTGSLMGVTISEIATKIDKQRVDEAKFKLPEGAQIEHEPEADRVVRDQIDLMFTSMLAGKRPPNPHEKAADDMAEAMKAMQQFKDNGGMEAFQNQMQQMQNLFNPNKSAE